MAAKIPSAPKRRYSVGSSVWAKATSIFSKEEGDKCFGGTWKTGVFHVRVIGLLPRKYLVEFAWESGKKVVSLHGNSLWDDEELAQLQNDFAEEDFVEEEFFEPAEPEPPAATGNMPLTRQELGEGYLWDLASVEEDVSKSPASFVAKLNWSRANPPPGMTNWSAPGAKTPIEALHEFMNRGIAEKLLEFWENSGMEKVELGGDVYLHRGVAKVHGSSWW